MSLRGYVRAGGSCVGLVSSLYAMLIYANVS